jgi:hypothetical protein
MLELCVEKPIFFLAAFTALCYTCFSFFVAPFLSAIKMGHPEGNEVLSPALFGAPQHLR